VLRGHCSLAAALRPAPGGAFDVLAGRSGTPLLAAFDRLPLDELRHLAGRYDLVLLDLSAGVDHAVRRLLAFAEEHLVITIDEPTALTDAYAVLKICQRQLGRPLPGLVLNQAADHAVGQRTHGGLAEVCQRFLGAAPPLLGVVRRDPRVPDSIRQQVPLLVSHPASPAAEDVRALARGLVLASAAA
jgi:flagellar biosynthesis protein FlhG